MEKLYIIIPAYNEQDTIGTVIEEWYPIIEKHNGDGASRLVIINDGSTDHTADIVEKYAKERTMLLSITKENGGHGAAVLYGYHFALQQNADYVFQTDSDGQTRPEEFEPFWENRTQYDMVIGWRGSREDGFSRWLVSKVLKGVIRVCFGVSVKDANTPYRIMNAETLSKYIELIPDGFHLSNVLLSVIYAKKANVKYIPITFRPRQGGTNSINMKKIFMIGLRAVKDFREINKIIK